MAVFRIERTRDYTVMSNHHLRNANLSLKAKGLLSMMLSLPEDWNYTTRCLAKICKEGVDAIGAALRELEAAGYIVRHKLIGRIWMRLMRRPLLTPFPSRPRGTPLTVSARNTPQCYKISWPEVTTVSSRPNI